MEGEGRGACPTFFTPPQPPLSSGEPAADGWGIQETGIVSRIC